MIVDGCAGPGGWEEALRLLGRTDVIGIEIDAAACATRAAAGHKTIRASVADYPPEAFAGKCEGLTFSPPCQTFSRSGKRAGLADPRGQLVWQPVRWAEIIRPRWVALEQVPDVLPIWRMEARRLNELGYSTWTGLCTAEMFAVPQTRERAILIASLDRTMTAPTPTHQRYEPGVPARHVDGGMFGDDLLPWRSMADALGWGYDDSPARTMCGDRTPRWLYEDRDGTHGRVLHTNRGQDENGDRQTVPTDRPAPTLTAKAGGQWEWVLNPGRTPSQPHRRLYRPDEPAPTVAFGHDAASGCWERPATTIVGSFCPDVVAAPGYRTKVSRQDAEGSVKITLAEALVLQSFRPDYPVQGNKTQKFRQVGDAIPPLLAAAVLAVPLGLDPHNPRTEPSL